MWNPAVVAFLLLTLAVVAIALPITLVETRTEDRVSAKVQRADKILVYTHHQGKSLIPDSSQKTEVAGMDHCERCLLRQMFEGKESGRQVQFAPPSMMLEKDHNNGNRVPDHVWWDRYYDLDHLVEKGIMVKRPVVKHEMGDVYGKITPLTADVKSVEYVHPSSKVSAKNKSDVVVSSWGHGNVWMCFQTRTGRKPDRIVRQYFGDMGLETQEQVFKPSRTVLKYADACDVGDNYAAVHVRRGDVMVTTGSVYAGVPGKYYVQIVHPKFIMDKLKTIAEKGMPVVIFTNETDDGFYREIEEHNSGHFKLAFERDILENVENDYEDNFLTYMVSRVLFRRASIRVSSVYDKLGRSTHRLSDYLKEVGYDGPIE